MKFKEVTETLVIIEPLSSRIAITQELAKLFKKANPNEAQILAYFFQGALKPPYLGTQFALAQKTMIKIIAEFVGTSEAIITKEKHKTGDLGSVLELYASSASGDLTVTQVYHALIELEAISGNGSQEKKSIALQKLLKEVGPLSGKYIIRIIMGTLRLGFSDMTVIDAFSWMDVGDKSFSALLERAYTICADLGLIAYTLKKEGIDAIRKMEIHVGIPIRPAAAERLPNAKAIIEKLGPCVVEPKLDGFRLQLHVNKTGTVPLIRFFSRNLIDMSDMFPEFKKVCLDLPVETIIVDGEAIVYDPNTGTYVPFQETVKRRRKHGIEELVSELPLQLNVFDILYLNGKSLLSAEQKMRRKTLRNIFATYIDYLEKNPKKEDFAQEQLSVFTKGHHKETVLIRTLEMIKEIEVTTAKELEQYFLEQIGAGLEGVVVKKTDASYQAGKRNFNWIKLKYEASSKLEDSIDVVILGYYAGSGKRAKFGIGAFLVGIYNNHRDLFETVAKVGTGLSDVEWHELKKKCDGLALLHPSKNVVCSPELTPTVWVEPKIVCEVLADEITVSPLHTAGKTKDKLGIALRFPRFVKYRPDKLATQTTSLKELGSLQ